VVTVTRKVADGDLGIGDSGPDQFFDFACVHRHLRFPVGLPKGPGQAAPPAM
jgi:hypothetical protein